MAPESKAGGIVWSWTRDTWSWNPAFGRWSVEHGVPKSVAFLEISTGEIPAKERYDFWREMVFYDFEADHASYDEKEGFRARGAAVMAPRGDFVVYRSDGISGHRTPAQARREEGGDIAIGVVFAGARQHELQCGTTLTAPPGEPFVYDPDRPCRVQWSAHIGAHLKLRRKAVESAVGGKLPPESTLVKAVAHSHLWPFLRSLMTLFGETLTQMPAPAQAAVLNATIDLALAMLREIVSPSADAQAPVIRDGIFAAAKRHIEENLSDPFLDADAVARAVACSRATLYRIFAEHDLTVKGYIRELRLHKFATLLQNADEGTTISQLAERCGVLDPTTLTKLFKERHGMTPREMLQMRRSQ